MLVKKVIAALFLFGGVSAKLHHRGVAHAARAADGSISGIIQINSQSDDGNWGYVVMEQNQYVLGWIGSATKFTIPSGQTTGISLEVKGREGMYLAGVIPQDQTLGDDLKIRALLGDSLPTKPGSPPQTSTNPTIEGLSETAIWSYDAASGVLTPHWVNKESSQPVKTSIFFDYKTLYLSGGTSKNSMDHLMTFTFVPTA